MFLALLGQRLAVFLALLGQRLAVFLAVLGQRLAVFLALLGQRLAQLRVFRLVLPFIVVDPLLNLSLGILDEPDDQSNEKSDHAHSNGLTIHHFSSGPTSA